MRVGQHSYKSNHSPVKIADTYQLLFFPTPLYFFFQENTDLLNETQPHHTQISATIKDKIKTDPPDLALPEKQKKHTQETSKCCTKHREKQWQITSSELPKKGVIVINQLKKERKICLPVL